MLNLSINLNKVACIRNARGGNCPDVLAFAQAVLECKADGLTVHPRPDMRHITPDDVRQISDLTGTHEFNIEGNPFHGAKGDYPGYLALVEQCRPDQATLVPDSIQQLTSTHGWDFNADGDELQKIIAQIQSWGTRVSLFVNPCLQDMQAASELGTDRIEIYTGDFASAITHGNIEKTAKTYHTLVQHALSFGLGVNAGHDLSLENLAILASIPGIDEVSIGQAFIADCLFYGLKDTMARYQKEISIGHERQ